MERKPEDASMAEMGGMQEVQGSRSNPLIMRTSSLENVPSCRICYNGPSRERLLRPCKCKGTIQYVHRNCLQRWLESTNCQTCEICHHHFNTRRTRKSCWEWFRQSDARHDSRNFIADCTCFAFLTPLGVATFWLCAEGALYYQNVKNSTLETVALVSLAVFLVLAYVTWILLCTRYHWVIWSRWRSRHWNVHIEDMESASSQHSCEVINSSRDNVLLEPLIPTDQTIRILPLRSTNIEPDSTLQNVRAPYRVSMV